MAIFDNGKAPETQSANVDWASVPRSAHNMSRVHQVTGLIGALMPVDVMECVPNEDYTLNYAALIETRNPLIKPLKSGMKMIFHTYFQSSRDIIKSWDMFISRGKDGNYTGTLPKLYPCVKPTSSGTYDHDPTNDYTTLTPCSPADYMGIPVVAYDKTMVNKNYCYTPCKVTANTKINNGYGADINNTTKWGLNALPFMMYNNICAEYYYPKNLLIKNNNIYPSDNERKVNDAPLSGTGVYVNVIDSNRNIKCTKFSTADVSKMLNGESEYYIPTNKGTNDSGYTEEALNCLHFRCFRGDYFNTANPFADMLRGDKSKLALPQDIDWTGLFRSENSSGLLHNSLEENIADMSGITSANQWNEGNLTINPETSGSVSFYDTEQDFIGVSGKNTADNKYYRNVKAGAVTLKRLLDRAKVNGVSLNNLRKAAVLEKFMQRNATTDGSYKQFIQAQFGYMPKIHETVPRYVGGSAQVINADSVTQTSATNGADILGHKAGFIEDAAMHNIGKFHCDDYGYLMTIACIVPDVYYDNQGLATMWTRTEQDQVYIPLMNNLEPQPILNKELFVTGNKSYDEDVWGYANRYEDMKSRQNIISGLAACGNNATADSQGWIKRVFDKNNPPALNNQFLTMSPANIDLVSAGFSSANEPPFNITIGCSVDKVTPMPATPVPADLGIKF